MQRRPWRIPSCTGPEVKPCGECEWKRGDGQPKQLHKRIVATTVALTKWPSHGRFHEQMMHYRPTSSQHAVGSRCLAWGKLFSDRFIAGLPLCSATSWDGPKWIEEKEHVTIIVVLGVPQDVHVIHLAAAFSCVTYKLGGHFNPPFCKVPFPPFVKYRLSAASIVT